jgi:hypothetical protein
VPSAAPSSPAAVHPMAIEELGEDPPGRRTHDVSSFVYRHPIHPSTWKDGILRTSPVRSSRKFVSSIRRSAGVRWHLLVVPYMACAYCLRLLEDKLVRFVECRPDYSIVQNLDQIGSRIVLQDIENPFTV